MDSGLGLRRHFAKADATLHDSRRRSSKETLKWRIVLDGVWKNMGWNLPADWRHSLSPARASVRESRAMWLQIPMIASRIVRLGDAELNLKIKSAIWHYVCLRSKELLRNDMWFGADLLRDARLVPGREPMTQQQRIIKCPRKSFPRLSGKSSGSINVRIFQKNDPVSLRASYSIESGSLSELLNPASLSRVTATTSNWFHQIFNCMDCGTNVVLALRTWIATTTLAGLLKGLQTILKGEHHVS
jgi:hypothetical protein